MSAVAARLADGRLHLQHGPIDLIIEAFGAADQVERAYRQAIERFGDILPTLVHELPALRRSIGDAYPLLQGPVARRMAEAVWPHRAVYITPMAAVAGAVADEMLQALVRGRALDKAYVNDGGDIAIHLTPGHELRAGIFAAALDGVARLTWDRPVRGIATSGRGGRSFSLGLADSATVLAETAAAADAAATLIANAVNVDHPSIERRPARELDPDSDLGDLPVTVAVGVLPPDLVEEALDRGATECRRLRLCGLIDSAALSLQGCWRIDAQSSPETIEATTSRRLDRGPPRLRSGQAPSRAERPFLHNKPLIVETRSLVYVGFGRMCERATASNSRPSPDLSP
jgi:uncharacterized protein